jgi:hypothetical protein
MKRKIKSCVSRSSDPFFTRPDLSGAGKAYHPALGVGKYLNFSGGLDVSTSSAQGFSY